MSSLVMEIEDYELSPGVPVAVSRTATYFLLMIGAGVNIQLSYKGTRIGGGEGLQGGDGVGPLSQPYDQVTLTSDTAQTVKIATSSDPVTITRLSGVVQVDGVAQTAPDFSRVLRGESYVGGRTRTAISGEYSYIQIFNPATASESLVVPSVFVRGEIAGNVFVIPTDTELNATFNNYVAGEAHRMDIGNPHQISPDKVIRSGTSAINGALSSAVIGAAGTVGNGWIELRQPFVIRPGAGLGFQSRNVNEEISVNAQLFKV